jgi:diguanylate cyclase (GGDEF)-like protein
MAERQRKRPKRTPPDAPAAPTAPAFRVGEDRYKALVEQLPVGIYRTTLDGMIIEANAVLVRMLGHKRPQTLFDCNVEDFYVKGEDRSRVIEKLSSKPTSFQEFELRRIDGRRFWVRDYCRGVKGPDGSIHHLDGILVDITDRKTAERKLAKRLKEDNYLVFLDIDYLKEVNDAHGHAVGDLLLQGVAAILRSTLRESDVFGRIGGDEFAVLAMRSKGLGERALLARIEEGVRTFRVKKFGHLRLSVSMGLVRVDPQKYQQLDDFLAHADFLMYQQKRSKERKPALMNYSGLKAGVS